MKRTDMKRMIVAAALLGCAAAPAAGQGLTSGPYELPYKNTYVKEVFVAENEYRTTRPERIEPLPFEQAREILPAPVWEGHDREIEMYWHAWRIAVGNIRQPQEGSGFVSPYLDIAYNGNIFMWDMSFMMMYARYGYRYFPFQRSLDNFYAKQHPDGFICREIRADGSDCFERYDPTSTGPDLLPWVELPTTGSSATSSGCTASFRRCAPMPSGGGSTAPGPTGPTGRAAGVRAWTTCRA